MKAIILNLGLIFVGLIFTSSIYWVRLGSKGAWYKQSSEVELTPNEALQAAANYSTKFNAAKEYSIQTDETVFRKRGTFPFYADSVDMKNRPTYLITK